MAVKSLETRRVVVKRPLCNRGTQKGGIVLVATVHKLVGRAIEHTEAEKRCVAPFGQQRFQLGLEKIAGFIGQITRKPFSGVVGFLYRIPCGFEFIWRVGADDR